jgi:hypothetical protein
LPYNDYYEVQFPAHLNTGSHVLTRTLVLCSRLRA